MALRLSGLNVGPHRRRRYIPPAKAAKDSPEPIFDPAEHTIPEVVAHAGALDSNGVIALIALEQEGKGRSTLLKKLEEHLEAVRLAESDDEADDETFKPGTGESQSPEDVEGSQEPVGGPETGEQGGSLDNPLDDDERP